MKKVSACFFMEDSGNEPVKQFLRQLTKEGRVLIAKDIRTAEYGWPVGMPTCRHLGGGLQEVRTNLPNRIARVLFRVDTAERMVLPHGFFKKTQATGQTDIDLANKRWLQHVKGA